LSLIYSQNIEMTFSMFGTGGLYAIDGRFGILLFFNKQILY